MAKGQDPFGLPRRTCQPWTMEWLAHDEVPVADLPEWTREGGEPLGEKLAIHREGLVHRSWRKATALPWEQILTIVTLEGTDRVLICAPRKPPREPWIAIEEEIRRCKTAPSQSSDR